MKRWTNGLPGATKRLGAKMALRGLAASQPRMRADTHDGPEQIAPLQRPDTLMQLSRSLISEVHLVPHGRAIHLAQSGHPDISARHQPHCGLGSIRVVPALMPHRPRWAVDRPSEATQWACARSPHEWQPLSRPTRQSAKGSARNPVVASDRASISKSTAISGVARRM